MTTPSGAAVRRGWHRRIWKTAAPIMVSNLGLPVVGMVDTALAGHLPGPEYLGGVGVAALIFSFTFWTFGFLRLSTTGYIAQAFGRGDREELKAIVIRAAVIALVIAFALIVLQDPLRRLALDLVEAGPLVSHQAALYFDVRIWAAPAVMGNFIVAGALIGLQRTGLALVVQAVIVTLNVGLDILFVPVLGWGVEGLAAATAIAEGTGLATGLVALVRALPEGRGPWPFGAARIVKPYWPLLALNRDLLIRTLLLNVAFGVFISLSARIDDTTLAANEVLMMFLTFAAFALDGFANACEAIVGEACGRRDPRMLREAVRVTFLWSGLTAVVVCLGYALGGELLILLLTDIPEVRAEALAHVHYAILMPVIGVWSFQLDGIFTGAARGRDIRNAMVLAVVIYLPAIYLLHAEFGNDGLWLGLALLFAVRALALWRRYPGLARDVAPAP
ncbi:MAG: MATE family efflux transporter [bacterium]|nr:MATE family efflux transporter [bacterium]MDE0416689.1 MATE family efflux transporter [bacterium]